MQCVFVYYTLINDMNRADKLPVVAFSHYSGLSTHVSFHQPPGPSASFETCQTVVLSYVGYRFSFATLLLSSVYVQQSFQTSL